LNVTTLPQRTTHPETAWLQAALPVLLTLALILVLTWIFRGTLLALVRNHLGRRAAARRLAPLDPALFFAPQVLDPEHLCVGLTLLSALIVLLFAYTGLPLSLALLLAVPATLLAGRGLIACAEWRYVCRLETALPAALQRVGMLMQTSELFAEEFARVTAELPEGPLKWEWQFVLQRVRAILATGASATLVDVLAALADQTLSLRHARVLADLEAALRANKTKQLVERVQAIADGLFTGLRQASEARTAMTHMRGSAIVIGGAGVGMSLVLLAIQTERVMGAYRGFLGTVALIIVLVANVGPTIYGFRLSNVADIDY
jgi:hypothetical protein